MTTARRPLKSLSRYERPSDAGSVKSGAISPGFSSTDDVSRRVITFTTLTTIAVAVAHTDRSNDRIRGIRVILVRGPHPSTRPAIIFFCMRRGSPILRITTAAACLFSVTACDKLGLGGDKSPTAPSGPPPPGSSIVYTAIGASDAIGFGSSVVCTLFTDCPNGMGYVPVAGRTLRSQNFTVRVDNLGIPTAVISARVAQLGATYGRTIAGNFIDSEMPFVKNDTTIVTIFAGGNDVNTITAALGGGAGGSDPAGYIDTQVRAFGTDYNTLINGIRSRASQVRIVVLNLPNLAALPYLATASLAQRQAAQRASVAITRTVINPLVSSTMTIVDLMCDSRSYQTGTYSSDGFHPNDAGYAFMASEVVKAMTSSNYPVPQSICAAMTIVP
jgi:lysophospholipase L1-like esterase